ncbi:MAG: hypothetical protein KAJ51_09770, partial [Thermoplasmata archaeon]|nr:hypothetical protein [Thermoplasmata archaeon]
MVKSAEVTINVKNMPDATATAKPMNNDNSNPEATGTKNAMPKRDMNNVRKTKYPNRQSKREIT